MHIVDYPGCCTAKVITGFGGTSTAEYGYRPIGTLTQTEVEEALKSRCKQYKERGHAIITATTNDDQVVANKALEAQGWESSKWCTKGAHGNKKLKLWFKCLMDLED